MATAQSALKDTQTGTSGDTRVVSGRDAAESILKNVDESTKGATNINLFHILTLDQLGLLLPCSCRQKGSRVFVGLWPPTVSSMEGRS